MTDDLNDRLNDDELERTLEAGARRGSVQATLALLRLRERREQPVSEPEPEGTAEKVWRWAHEGDPFVAISPSELAYLSPEQVQEARELADAAFEERITYLPREKQEERRARHLAVLDGCEAEAERLRG